MGEYLKACPYPRNAFSNTARESAKKAVETIDVVRAIERGESAEFGDKAEGERFNDARLFLQTVDGSYASPRVTEIGELYSERYLADPVRAWRWLSIRSAWLGWAPNRSNSKISRIANQRKDQVNVFDLLVRTLDLLQHRAPACRGFTIDEYVTVMHDDAAWKWNPGGISHQILALREEPNRPRLMEGKRLLEVEEELGISRDSLNTLFGKFAIQTGLFDLYSDDGGNPHHGVELSPVALRDPVLSSMFKHVLMYPRPFNI